LAIWCLISFILNLSLSKHNDTTVRKIKAGGGYARSLSSQFQLLHILQLLALVSLVIMITIIKEDVSTGRWSPAQIPSEFREWCLEFLRWSSQLQPSQASNQVILVLQHRQIWTEWWCRCPFNDITNVGADQDQEILLRRQLLPATTVFNFVLLQDKLNRWPSDEVYRFPAENRWRGLAKRVFLLL
jgi:hypothetical protein